MSLGRNIADFRKRKGFTQEELGVRLGVTNQAVSKWENETSLPDILLLPSIADALGVTLNALYGIEEKAPEKVRADDFPEAAREMLKNYFVEQAGARMPGGPELGERVLGCVSDKAGAVFISKDFSLIDNTFRVSGSETVFERPGLLSMLEIMSDKMVMKVFAYLYRISSERFAQSRETEKPDALRAFTVPEVAEGCCLDKSLAEEALDTLSSLHLAEAARTRGGETEYCFSTDRAQFVHAIFHILEILFSDSRVYALRRDSSKNSDYLFEKLW